MAEKSYLDQFAKVISDMLDIDVLIVDKNLNLLGKCLVYYDLYQKIDYGSLLSDVIKNGENYFVKNRKSIIKCKECVGYNQCKIEGFVGVPIRENTEIIGALALIIKKKQVDKLFRKLDSTYIFMENMAELIGKRIVEHESKKRLKEKISRIESIIEAMPEALLYCNELGKVFYQNKSLLNLFSVKKPLNSIWELSQDLGKYLLKGKAIKELKISIENENTSFYGTASITPILKENNIKEYLCYFKSYSQIQKESNLFSNSTMVTFSWLSKYLSKESIEECKELGEKNEFIFLNHKDNALNELIAKAIVNYSDRRLQELRVIYMQNVYRDLMDVFLFDEHGILWRIQGGSIIIVQPEKMLISVQEKLADFMEKELIRVHKKEVKNVSIQIIFCSTENLENLVKRKLFSYRLYKLILKNKIPELQSVYNNKTVFERFFKSGILYYQKVYGKIKLHGIEEVYQKLWNMIDNQDLSTIETYIESYVKNKADISATPLLNYTPKTVREIEREILEETLKNGDTVQNMCKQLGISRSSFYRKVKKYQLDYKMSKKIM